MAFASRNRVTLDRGRTRSELTPGRAVVPRCPGSGSISGVHVADARVPNRGNPCPRRLSLEWFRRFERRRDDRRTGDRVHAGRSVVPFRTWQARSVRRAHGALRGKQLPPLPVAALNTERWAQARGKAVPVESSPGVVSSPSVGSNGHGRRLPRQQGRVPHPGGSWLVRLGRRGRPIAVYGGHLRAIL